MSIPTLRIGVNRRVFEIRTPRRWERTRGRGDIKTTPGSQTAVMRWW